MDARSLLAMANLRKGSRYLADRGRLEAAKKEDWRWVGFDSTIGMGVVRSGNIVKRGKVITNGYLVEGQPVEFNEDGQFATIEGKPYIKPQPRSNPQFVPREPTTPSIAILFEAEKDGGARGLYVGGLTAEPIEIAAPGSGFVTAETPARYVLDNTGEGTYKIAFNNGPSIGILDRWSTINADQKISPATSEPGDRVETSEHVGNGIFVGRTDYIAKRLSVPFYLGVQPGSGYVEGQSGTATWTVAIRDDAPALLHQTTISATATLSGGLLSIVGTGSYVFPDGTLEPVSISRLSSGSSYRGVQVLFAESEYEFVYRVDTYDGPLVGDIAGTAANPIVSEYYHYRNGVRAKVAESTTINNFQAAVSGSPIEIEFAARLTGRLVGATIYTPLTNFFGQGGQPSDPMTGTYEVQEIDLFGGTVIQKTYSVNPIPANYVIPTYALGGVRIWNASFNFEL